jgi:hypothetical protein
VQTVMDSISETFKDFGNETDQSALTLNRFTSALRETGLTAKESLRITGDLIKNIGGMDTAQKAFLSSRSGGPGGLQGAAQIDMLLRQGKEDQVMRMAQQSLMKQFGGNITTEEEGARSQSAASQNMRQRMMIQSGVFGIGKGATDAEAQHILEALKKGDMGGAVKVGKEAVKEVSEKGTSVQVQMNNYLKNMDSTLKTGEIYQQLTALSTIKLATGAGSEKLEQLMRDYNSKAGIAQQKEGVTREKGVNIRGAAGKASVDEGKAMAANNAVASMGNLWDMREGVTKTLNAGATGFEEALSGLKEAKGQQDEGVKIKRGNMPAPVKGMAAHVLSAQGTKDDHKGTMAAHALGALPVGAHKAEHDTAKVSIEVTAAPGLNVKVKSNSKMVNVIQQQNVAALRGHPTDEPGY